MAFDYKLQEYKERIPNLISRRQFNDRRKKTADLCERIRKRLALGMDGGEDLFFVDSKPIKVCRVARGSVARWGARATSQKLPTLGTALLKAPTTSGINSTPCAG